MSDVVRASASIPVLFPSVPVQYGQKRLLLTEGASATACLLPLPDGHHCQPRMSSCRTAAGLPSVPQRQRASDLRETVAFHDRNAWAPSSTLRAAVRHGAAAVTDEILTAPEAGAGLWRFEIGSRWSPGALSDARETSDVGASPVSLSGNLAVRNLRPDRSDARIVIWLSPAKC